ncbi:MAG: hypothetical protein NTY30_00130 [Candidatus Berkelbacteria bacterium]|nr:hypothetical protein [Candidatus Berkelbacteria bacterium]
METYLKDEQHYIDQYDRFTVDRCRRLEKNGLPKTKPKSKKESIKQKWAETATNVALHFVTGEEYANKKKTISAWMESDRQKDYLLENTTLDISPRCLNCQQPMEFDFKELHGRDNDHVQFFFRCTQCRKGRFFLETGEEYIPPQPRCPKCNTVLSYKSKREKNKLIHISKCPDCNYVDKWILDLDEKKKPTPIDPNFESDRERFCLSEEEGQKYLDQYFRLKQLQRLTAEEDEKKKHKIVYDQVEKIEKLTLSQVDKLLTSELQKINFTSLQFSKPEIDQFVIVEFSIQDDDPIRIEYDSKLKLIKAIEKELENTNWRMMSDGVDYRVGILSGRLKAYDRESDLLKLAKAKLEEK